MSLELSSTIKLNNDVDIPVLGFGAYQLAKGDETYNAVRWALESGYRHIDTAQFYQNEKEVGTAIRESGIAREEIFVTTKLANANHGYEQTKIAFDASLKALGTDYIDLFLLHWPVEGKRLDSWKALEELVRTDECRSIGVSNFTEEHIDELMKGSKIVPAMNQVEFHPFLYQRGLFNYCQQHEIVITAYSPLTAGERLDDQTITSIAHSHNKTPAQVMIRWALQHDVVVIPKSAHKERIIENVAVFDFELSEEDMQTLDGLNEGLRFSWNPYDPEQVVRFS
ncbi:aldo/keto reductase [candidate division WWE3 bacterium]|uniref:Aldo/keto reductase n=1 Tax=candidate division WWE3 bacterium TaxID=2053526 RepID=A0A955LKE1_UNCKA|nr:aldo/keto reductase [candidate division WWE3 bacterium]